MTASSSPPPPEGTTGATGWALAAPDGRIVAADLRFAELASAATPSALTGRSWLDLVSGEDASRAEEARREATAGRSWRGTLRLGEPSRPVDLTLAPASDPAGGMVVLRAMEPARLVPPDGLEPRARVATLEAVAESPNLDAAARAVLQELAHAVDFDWSALVRFEDDRAIIVACYPSPMAGAGPGTSWSPLDPTEAALIASGAPAIDAWLQATPAEGSPLSRLTAFGLRSALRIPIFAGPRVVAAAVLYRGPDAAFAPEDGLLAERLVRPLGRRLAEPSTAPIEVLRPVEDAEPGPPPDVVPAVTPEEPAPPTADAIYEPPVAEPAAAVDEPVTEGTDAPDRLEAIGDFVAGLAHELNSPLTSIAGWARMLPSLPEGDRDDALSTIERDALRLGRIVQNLLYFSRRQPAGSDTVDLAALMRRVAEVRRTDLDREGIELTLELSEVPAVRGDEFQLELVLLNLVSNAEEALRPSGGSITATVTQANGAVRVTVADTGPGIPSEVLPRVFEPFFTTRDAGQGTGLGLSTAYGIVHELGGTLAAESPPEGRRPLHPRARRARRRRGTACGRDAP